MLRVIESLGFRIAGSTRVCGQAGVRLCFELSVSSLSTVHLAQRESTFAVPSIYLQILQPKSGSRSSGPQLLTQIPPGAKTFSRDPYQTPGLDVHNLKCL